MQIRKAKTEVKRLNPNLPMRQTTDTRAERTQTQGLLPLSAIMLAGFSTFAHQALAQQVASDTAKELPTIQVQADADKPDGLRASATRLGKVVQDPHDIPQAVTTITKSLMEQQQVGSLREA